MNLTRIIAIQCSWSRFWLFFATLWTAGQAARAQDRDRDGLTDSSERGVDRYEVVSGSFSWIEAQIDAERRGGHLATVINDREWGDLKQILGARLFGKNLWLGGTDEGTEGQWRWITGERWSFTNWRTNEPGNASLGNGQGEAENHLMIWGNETEFPDGYRFYWNDATVSGGTLARDGYILERRSWTDPDDPDTDDDGLSDAEETWFSLYQVIETSDGMSWFQAKEDAEARHGHLATINSLAEWNLILSTVGTKESIYNLWLGGTDSVREGRWQWITGEPFAIGRWAEGEPNNSGEEDHLTLCCTEGRWNDLSGHSILRGYLLELGSLVLDPNNPDTDGDQLKDGDELKFWKTDPTHRDTDSDGLSDEAELRLWRTDPRKPDTDEDGLSDPNEVELHHTDPNQLDTDGDGFSDKIEVDRMSNPLVTSSIPGVPAQIRPAVEVEFESEPDVLYIIQAANADGGWQRVGSTIIGAGGRMKRLFSSSHFPKGIWRVALDLHPSREGFAYIPSGTFVMGSPNGEQDRRSDEIEHQATLTRGFWMGKYEVTQQEYSSVLGYNPSRFRNGVEPDWSVAAVGGLPATGGAVTNELQHPVEQVSWNEATNYCAKLTQLARLADLIPEDYEYRLPTEWEWEYACKAGATNAFGFGTAIRQGLANFNTFYEYESSSGVEGKQTNVFLGRTREVGSYAANAFGLYDLHGNVWEWCAGYYGPYPTGKVSDPKAPSEGTQRVFRGGGWNSGGNGCRAANRYPTPAEDSYSSVGFRVVLDRVR
ncbi:MAG: SUMF1/EgtB/PvdO family nonheme iron enzyme [Verrucomicrobiales bacterium]|nr:SUMF1/EgtB/PvdO family nonheme iron enzyme [Verrucomicrobiales bacterium]